MTKPFDAVDEDHRYVRSVARNEIATGVDVDLAYLHVHSRFSDRLFRFIAKTAVAAGVEGYARHCRSLSCTYVESRSLRQSRAHHRRVPRHRARYRCADGRGGGAGGGE